MDFSIKISDEGHQTVGALSSELIKKDTHNDHSPVEQMRENLTDYDKNFYECLYQGKKRYPDDFYIVVITKREPLLKNVFRNYFFHRHSCPTPEYDQACYRFIKKKEEFEFLWVIPAKDICIEMKNNQEMVPPDQFSLLHYVLSFIDGSLLKKSKMLNGE